MAGRDYWADLEDRLSYHGDPAQEELEIEFNARYDYLAEQAAEHADLADDYDDEPGEVVEVDYLGGIPF